MRFNRNEIKVSGGIEQPTDSDIQATFGLHRATLQDAAVYGGTLVREALSTCPLKNDHPFILVDAKVHMLMPGFVPAIPGWHTDGVPRPGGVPDIHMQDTLREDRFHLLVTGEGCLTEFVSQRDFSLAVPVEPTSALYKFMSRDVERLAPPIWTAPSCKWVTFDWWDIHRGPSAAKREWRLLIRVTESDRAQPLSDLRKVIRTQQQVYAPLEFGW